jgi:hypothetical protein
MLLDEVPEILAAGLPGLPREFVETVEHIVRYACREIDHRVGHAGTACT